MKNRNVKVIDEHNIDRNANVMFAVDLNGSEYVVYWIMRDEESNNVFVSKVLKNIDGTYNMLNIDDADKKKEVSEIVKFLISSAVSDQNDKLVGLTKTLSNGENAKFINVSFNKEQNINVPKTYITTVKKEVTKVVEDYYDVVTEEEKIENVLSAAPVIESAPEIVEPITNVETANVAPVVTEPVATIPTPVETPVVAQVLPEAPVVAPVTPLVVETPVVAQPIPTVVVAQPTQVVTPAPVAPSVPEQVVMPAAPVIPEAPVVVPATPLVVETPVVAQPTPTVAVAQPTQVVPESIVNTPQTNESQLVFNASKETNLNAALGEVANSNAIPVENINVVREFGEEVPVVQTPTQPGIAPMVQSQSAVEPKVLVKKAGFANSKFFMVIAIAFFMASCIFLGYEVFNYFQLTK